MNMLEVDNTFNTIDVYCDGKACTNEERIDSDDFSVMSKEIKENGWRIVRDEETKDWFHYCPKCLKDNNF